MLRHARNILVLSLRFMRLLSKTTQFSLHLEYWWNQTADQPCITCEQTDQNASYQGRRLYSLILVLLLLLCSIATKSVIGVFFWCNNQLAESISAKFPGTAWYFQIKLPTILTRPSNYMYIDKPYTMKWLLV
jgi:hypothetical protein